jgi:hypothetical protein
MILEGAIFLFLFCLAADQLFKELVKISAELKRHNDREDKKP